VLSLLPLGAYLYFSYKVFPIGDGSDIRVWGPMFAIGLLPLLAFTVAYFPMAFLIACLFDTVLPALNPLLIFRAIARIPMEYALAVALCLGFAAAGFLLALPLRFVPVLGGLGAAIVSSYFQFIELHIIGRMAHLTEQKLNWHLA
jgi:hypothetical protein